MSAFKRCSKVTTNSSLEMGKEKKEAEMIPRLSEVWVPRNQTFFIWKLKFRKFFVKCPQD